MEITNVHNTFGKLFFECSDFRIAIIPHEVRRIPHWVPSLDYGKCFTYRGLIFGLALEFSHNLISHVGMYTNEKKWNCVPCRFARGVHQGQFTTISFKHSLLQWLLMYKEEGFLSSSRSWFIFFVNDSVSGSVKEVAFGRLSLPLVYQMLLSRHRNTSLLKSPWQCGCARPDDKGSIAYLFSFVFVPRDGQKIDPLEDIYQETFAAQKSWLCFGLQGRRICQLHVYRRIVRSWTSP